MSKTALLDILAGKLQPDGQVVGEKVLIGLISQKIIRNFLVKSSNLLNG